MPPLLAALILKLRSAFKDMTDSILIIYGEKGITPFKKPLIIAAPSLLVLYLMVYSPISAKLTRSVKDQKNMQVVAQFAGDYEGVKTRLGAFQRRLPLYKDKDDWLNYLITNTARNSGVSVDSLGAQRENEAGAYLVVSRDVSATTTYASFGKWLAEIENSPIFLRITEMRLHREESMRGSVKVNFTLSTVFPRQGGGAK